MKRQLMITVDVEAQPRRASQDPLDRLIWGRYPDSNGGIDEMMDIADKHGVKLTMFLDYCEEPLYGSEIRKVGKHIHDRGHDVQLHAHPDFMTNEYWQERGDTRIANLNYTTRAQADILFDFLVQEHKAATGTNPVAFRGGGYRFNGHMLDAMVARGIMLDSSYNPPRKTQPLQFEFAKQFKWSNGCLEIPISCVKKYKNLTEPYEFNFSGAVFSSVPRMLEYVKNFHAEFGKDAIAMMVMHSWSFQNFDRESGTFTGANKDHIKRFDKFIGKITKTHDIVTSQDVIRLNKNNDVKLDPPLDIKIFTDTTPTAPIEKNPDMQNITNMSVEAICAEAERLWNDSDESNKAAAVEWFKAAYLQGSYSTAGYRLGCAYYLGQGVEQDLEMALPYFSSTYLNTNAYAQYFKGMILSDINFPRRDLAQAKKALEAASEKGVEMATEELEKLFVEKPVSGVARGGVICTICDSDLSANAEGDETCSACGAVSRTRTLPNFLNAHIAPLMETYAGAQTKLLALGMDAPEEIAIIKHFDTFVSASLFGNYRPGHMEGVDVRDLSVFEDKSFKGVCGMVIFDYFVEMKQALAECARVLDDGGVFFTNIIAYRLLDDDSAPVIDYKIEKKPGYYDYVPEEMELLSAKVSRGWFLKTMQEVGIEAQHCQIVDPVTGQKTDWFFGVKSANASTQAPVVPDLTSHADVPKSASDKCCNLCGFDMGTLDEKEINCPECHSAPRTRCMPQLLEKYITPTISAHPQKNSPLLAFAMNGPEEKILTPIFESMKSVSLYGKYRVDHEEGVDARDLSRYADSSFIGAMGVLVFDYFVEVEKAMKEIARVMVDGGMLFTHVSAYRLTRDNAAPIDTGAIKKRKGYFDYIPEKADMVSLRVGDQWFAEAMERSGFHTQHVQLTDSVTGNVSDWFIGTRKTRAKTTDTVPQAENKSVYEIELPAETGFKSVKINLSVPVVPDALKYAGFTEHMLSPQTGEATDTVIVGGTGVIGVSDDLGETWNVLKPEGAEGCVLWNSFTTLTGKHIVQSIGWQGPTDPVKDFTKHGAMFSYDSAWNFLGRSQVRDGGWHGTASIGQAKDTIMFGEYYNNLEPYFPGFDFDDPEHMANVRPCAIWRSQDDGLTWESTLETKVLEIRHFHTVTPDPYLENTWWASSGDKPHECRIWRSNNNGESWGDVTNLSPNVELHATYSKAKQATQRFTDLIITEDALIWGADDYLGDVSQYSVNDPIETRVGARLYMTPKDGTMMPREIGYIGHPVRSIIDVGPAWILLTEAKQEIVGLEPFAFMLMKDGLHLQKLFNVENHSSAPTGFTFSRASKRAKDGTFFCFKLNDDAFADTPRILKWDVEFTTHNNTDETQKDMPDTMPNTIPDLLAKAEQLWGDASLDPTKSKAVAHFLQAYALGDIKTSAYRLGGAYYHGHGVEQDFEAAYKYFAHTELDPVRFAVYYRGLILNRKTFSGYNPQLAAESLKLAGEMGVEPAKVEYQKLMEERKCSICQTVAHDFEDPKGRACPTCRSLERQRIVMTAYQNSISLTHSVKGQKGLLVSPAQAERKMMEEMGVTDLTSVDIRPEVGADLVADLCDMPDSETGKYDFVYASYVFTCVHSLDDALREIKRVLKPGGKLISIDPMAFGAETEEFTDTDKITSWYGQENFDKYKVGSFRRLGELGLLKSLSKHFDVQTYQERDPITGQEMVVFVSSNMEGNVRQEIENSDSEYSQGIVKLASDNERNIDCAFSQRYYAYLSEHPGVTYSEFAVSIEAISVSENNAHATLGANVTDVAKRTGIQTYQIYKNILRVQPNEKVVEYGCGSLRVGVGFINYIGKNSFYGLDVVPEFYEIGRSLVGEDVIADKGVVLHVIDVEGVAEATQFAPDIVFSSAVIFHIHPDEIQAGFDNLISIASKPGARLIFDAKVTRNDLPYRYEQSDRKSGWAWPLEFYRRALKPLELVGVHKRVAYDWDTEVDYAHLEFRNPIVPK